jgi:hypothetical protein
MTMGFQKDSLGVVLTRLSTSMTFVTSVSTCILMAGLNLLFPSRRFFMACLVAARMQGVFLSAPAMWYLTEVPVGVGGGDDDSTTGAGGGEWGRANW